VSRLATANPLQWPDGWPRTTMPTRSRFSCTFAQARDGILHQLDLMGVPDYRVVLSTNVPLRRDGLPYANCPEPDDPGAAVYWTTPEGHRRVMPCDRWDRVRDNLRAIERSLEALRGLDRWGTPGIVERAFTGFAALPAAASDWRSVLGTSGDVTLEQVRAQYRRLSREAHPDLGGSPHEQQRLNAAMAAAEAELA
jgi:hypothetical protein